MKKILKNVPVMALVLSFLFVSCSTDQDATNSTDEITAKSKLPTVIGDEWVEIGYIKDGMPIITFDTEKALHTLSANMQKYADIHENYTSVYIADIDGTYNLLFEGETYTTAFYVKEVKASPKVASSISSAVARIAAILVAKRKITCTTSECSHESTGCAVKYDPDNNDLPYCSPCANGGKCTKTDISNADVAQGVF